jgi:hypothetical protein
MTGILITPAIAAAQEPLLVKYCQDLTSAYRKGVSGGKSAVGGAGQAAANCPTDPDDSIGVLEGALREMKIELPKRSN